MTTQDTIDTLTHEKIIGIWGERYPLYFCNA